MNPPLFDDKNSPTFDNIAIAVTEKITGICTSNDRIQIAVSNGCVRRIEHVSVSTVSIVIKLLIYRVFVFKVGTELVKNVYLLLQFQQLLIEQYGYISINDPCCGAGATLIAGVYVIRKQLEHCDPPRNYQNHILVVAQDVDEIVGLMCYIQISLLGLAGFIKIGNSITDPMSTDDSSENYWYTPMYFSDIWSTRRMLRQINKLFGKGDDE